MTAREFIQTVLSEAPKFNAKIYIQQYDNPDEDPIDFDIVRIDNGGTNDAIFIEITPWKSSR
jgi:hypothetical protein